MTTKFVSISAVRTGHYYSIIEFSKTTNVVDIRLGRTNNENIISKKILGKLINVVQVGRPYDPDVVFIFLDDNGNTFMFEPIISIYYAYAEYTPETEEISKRRIIDRTLVLKEGILGNDWALRPENVVSCQCIDLSIYKGDMLIVNDK